MARSSKLGGSHDASIEAGTCADKENESTSLSNARYDFCSPAQVSCCHIEGDDMDALAYTEYVA